MSDAAFLQHCGWAGEDKAKEVWDKIGHLFPAFKIVAAIGDAPMRAMLWELVRKALGKDFPNIPQETGDCVAQGAKVTCQTINGVQIYKGEALEFHELFAPYFYSTGRVLVGKGQMGRSQGSVGSWQSKAAELYGALRSDFPGCPAYSGKLADDWGIHAPDAKYLAEGKVHLIKTTSKINSWDELHQAVSNGYCCTIASNQGFKAMLPGKDGFHAPNGTWGHQMSIWGTVNDPKRSYGSIRNTWGDVHGEVIDFDTGEKWPVGTLRVRREVIEHMIATGECIAYSQFEGFPGQDIDWYKLV